MNRPNIVFSREVESKKKNGTNKLIYKTGIGSQIWRMNLWFVKEGVNWEIGINIYTLLYKKQITNKDLMYSTGNSIQYSAMAYMGKQSKKEQMYVYVLMTHFAVQQKLI